MRECRLLNNNWKFTYGDQVTATSKEIASWQDIGIPHSFGIPYFMEKEFYVGYGTYSTWISLAEEVFFYSLAQPMNSIWDMELTQPGFH